jgi:hypothetical protein
MPPHGMGWLAGWLLGIWLLGNCFPARRTGDDQNRDGRPGVRGAAVLFFRKWHPTLLEQDRRVFGFAVKAVEWDATRTRWPDALNVVSIELPDSYGIGN